MIASLTGTITRKTDTAVIIQVAGVGYVVSVPSNELAALNAGRDITLNTHLAVKEDALNLYGSQDPGVIEWFVMLLNVKGIGPKSALSVVSAAGPQDLSSALHAESPDVLVNCGVSKKAAERIVLELKTKAKHLIDVRGTATKASIILDGEAVQALEALGYSREHAREALKQTEGDDVGAKVKAALKLLGK